MAPKGKQGTKGQKAIFVENEATLKFYTYISVAATATYVLAQALFFWETFTAFYIFMFLFTLVVYIGSYKFMGSMAKASFDENGMLLDGGIDLNMEDGMAENAKDLIILTAGVQMFSLLSNYFWLLLLLAPGRAFYMLWTSILAPWIFAEAPEVDEKKNKKIERKMMKRR